MKDIKKTKQQLIEEIESLRTRVAVLEQVETRRQPAEETIARMTWFSDNNPDDEQATGSVNAWPDIRESVTDSPQNGETSSSHSPLERAIVRLASFPECNPNPVVEVDLKGRVTYLNPAARRLFPDLVEAAPDGQPPGSHHPWVSDWESVVDRLQEEETGALTREVVIGQSYYQQAMYKGDNHIRIYGLDITRHKQAENALRARENRYRQLVQNASSAIIGWACDGTILFFNEYAETLFGYSSDEIVGKNVSLLVPEIESTGVDLTQLADDIIAHPERFVNNINENTCRDGRRIWMVWTNKPILDENGQISEILAVGIDITERKQAEEALHASEARYRHTLDAMLEGCQIIGFDWRYLYLNDVADEHNRRPKEELLGKRYMDMWPGIESTEVFSVIRRCMEERVSQSMENKFTFPDGSQGWFELRIYPVPEGIVMLSIDITKRKQAEKAVRRNEEQLRRSQEIAHLGSWELDLTDNRLTWSDEVYRIFGLAPQEFSATYEAFLERVHPDDRKAVDDAYTSSLREGRDAYEVEHRIVRKSDGEIRYVHEKCEHQRDESGTIICSTGMVHDITERKQAEMALRESEERFRRAIKEAPFPIIMHAEGGEVIALSDMWLELTGYTFQDISTIDKWTERAYGEERDEVKAGIDRLYGISGKIHEGEFTITTSYGTKRTWDFSSTPLGALPDGRRLALSMAMDVSKRKRAEMALRESEERFRRAIKEAPFPIMMHAEDGEVIALSDTWLELTGYALQDISTIAKWTERAFGDRSQLVKAEIDRLYQLTTKVKEGEYTITTSRGTPRMWDFSSTPLGTLPDGRRLVLSIAVDVTERRQAEEALLQANERLALAQQSAGAGVWDWDMLTGQHDWSPELFRLYGLDTAVPPTLDLWRSVLHPDDRQAAQDRIDEAIRDHKPLHSEYRIVQSSGELRWINALGNATYDEHGRARRISGICIDITNRKQMEEALHRTNLELQASNKELDAFGHTVAHDLKNPLGSIIGFANLLTDEENPLPMETIRELARSFEELSLRMDNIIEELMLLAGLRKAEVKMRPLNMAHIVAEAQRRLTYMIRNAHAEIIGPSDWPQAIGYSSWAEEIWINYISNAIKYGGQPPRIELGAAQQGDQVRFWVRDNGLGLTEVHKARLFQPFERLDQASLQGHGLGLSIVQRIAERMDGQVYVESTGVPGEGSVFGFVLPKPHDH